MAQLALGPISLSATGSTGNVTGTGVDLYSYVGTGAYDTAPPVNTVIAQFVIEAVGGTPTVTFKLQGSHDNTNWYDAAYLTESSNTSATAALTKTAVGAWTFILDPGLTAARVVRRYRYFRIVTSANTNVTFRAELYAYGNNN